MNFYTHIWHRIIVKRSFICHIDIVKADYNYALIYGLYKNRIIVELKNKNFRAYPRIHPLLGEKH